MSELPMKLLRLTGINDLRFGDSVAKATGEFGTADESRTHPHERYRTTLSFRKHGLHLAFNTDDRLTFIAITESEDPVELWGENPFLLARRPPDAYSSLRQWLTEAGRRMRPHNDCFGESLQLPDDGVVFCFSADHPGILEGIQLEDSLGSMEDEEENQAPDSA